MEPYAIKSQYVNAGCMFGSMCRNKTFKRFLFL